MESRNDSTFLLRKLRVSTGKRDRWHRKRNIAISLKHEESPDSFPALVVFFFHRLSAISWFNAFFEVVMC